MKLLSIETSCDETAAAIVESSEDTSCVRLLSHSLATSLSVHAQTGGIIPENAARAQIQYIIPVIYEALEKAKISWDAQQSPDIDAIAITNGPGLIGSLLVGVETAKTLSYVWNKPLIPVNHLFGHIYANWIDTSPLQASTANTTMSNQTFQTPSFPAIVLVVSGGHTDLLLMKSHTDITWLGGTRDDAAGEAFDKIGRLLHFSYPAGPRIEEAATNGDPKAYRFPRPLFSDGSFDFSFSGLKTAVLREVQNKELSQDERNNISRGVQDAIIDVLVKKTLAAAVQFNAPSIVLSGGVAANGTLRTTLQEMMNTKFHMQSTKVFAPPRFLCTDNAAMIGAAGFFRQNYLDWHTIHANPQLYFD